MNSIGERLKAERERLGFGLEAFAEWGGVKRNAQAHYEKDERRPDADYLSKITATGVDLQFILTGSRGRTAKLSDTESEVLDAFGRANSAGQLAALVVLKALANQPQNFARVDTAPSRGPSTIEQAPGQLADAELWRSIARGLPTAPGVDPNAELRLVDFLAVVDEAYARELAARTPNKAKKRVR
jgi:transcriptional regulator with XRE-family HTH domain